MDIKVNGFQKRTVKKAGKMRYVQLYIIPKKKKINMCWRLLQLAGKSGILKLFKFYNDFSAGKTDILKNCLNFIVKFWGENLK